MALELRQSLQLAQQLIMTPQLQQAIKLLQLSRLELLDAIYEEMEINPVLDEEAANEAEEGEARGGEAAAEAEAEAEAAASASAELPEVTVEERVREDVDWESYISEYNTGWAETAYEDRDLPQFENLTASKTNLYGHLLWQLQVGGLTQRQREIGEHIVGNLNEDGYLKASIEEIAEQAACDEAEAEECLHLIQAFDPVGVAARDMQECLLLQCRFLGMEGSNAEKIITDHLSELETKKYDVIARKLGITVADVVAAVQIIRTFEPKPGRGYSEEDPVYITPDIYVFKVGDEYQIVLNEDGLPKLRISPYYREVLSGKDGLPDTAKTYIQEKLRSAAWLIKSIHQRQRTIYRVTESIVRFQGAFLEHGITRLKPLVLRDVAEDIEMHESTVSRVTTNKYVYTPQGVYELKFFFNSAISTMGGEDVASESVKEHIRNIIKAEDLHKPYSDQEIAVVLRKLNIRVARRTVAKYRESMGLLPSRQRRNPYA